LHFFKLCIFINFEIIHYASIFENFLYKINEDVKKYSGEVMTQINYYAVVTCTLLYMVLGTIWYTILFGKPWMNLMEISPDELKTTEFQERAQVGFVTSIVCYFLMALTLSCFIRYGGAKKAIDGLEIGMLCWFGFTFTTMLPNHLFSKKPIQLALINLGHHLVGMSLIGMILAVWQ
jgi:hypothetical protein